MSELSLADAKAHLVIDFDDDDVLVQQYIDVAEGLVEGYLRRDMATDFPSGWPEPVLQAVRFLVAHFYENRDGGEIEMLALPYPVRTMLADFRIFV